MSEKIRLKGQLKLPVVGKNPTFAQMKFVKVALSEPDILPDSGSIFTCDEQGNYDFEIYTGAHLLSYNVGNAWSKSIEIIAEPLAEGLESIEISDLIGFQEIPELDATIAALNQQKQELLAIQQDVALKQESAVASAASAAEDAEKLADVTPESIGAVSNASGLFIKPNGGDYINSVEYHAAFKIAFSAMPQKFAVHARFLGRFTSHNSDLIIHGSIDSAGIWQALSFVRLGGTTELSINGCNDVSGQYFLVLNLGSPISNYELDVLTIQGTENNLSITSSVADDTPLDQIKITSYGDAAIDDDSVREMTYENKLYKNLHKDQADALRIPAADFNAALANQQSQDFFESEKAKAILIMNDHMLGTGEEEITDLQVMDVKAYIQSIDPSKGFKVGIVRAKVPRPSIFSRYD